MTRIIPVTLLALGALCASSYAQSATPASSPAADKVEGEKAKPRELSTLVFDEVKYGFVDPESRELYSGPITVTYPGGQFETEGELVDGLEDGYFLEYYPDGTKSGMGSYQAGDEVGPWIYWWENGKIESEGSFKDGQLDGVWRDYFPTGELATEGEYVNGLAQGKWRVTDDETGKLVDVYYDKGEEVAPPDSATSAQATPAPAPSASPAPTATPEPSPRP